MLLALQILAVPVAAPGITVIHPGGTATSRPGAEPIPLSSSPADTVHIGLPRTLDPAPMVKDPVFGLLIGLVSSGEYGDLSGDRLGAELRRLHANSVLPYQALDTLTRLPVKAGRTATVKVTFHGDLNLPIPYSILGYHPGSFNTSQTCIFREWIFDRLLLPQDVEGSAAANPPTLELDDVHLFGVAQGKVLIDIDGWLDSLMGDKLDDTWVTGLLLCRYRGEWFGFAMGYNRKGEGRSGALSFTKDRILFPTPAELRIVGPRMRAQMESLMKWWTMDEQRAAARQGASRKTSPG